MKIVINDCYGGFSLSDEAILHYGKLKGLKLYPERSNEIQAFKFTIFWTVPESKRPVRPDGKSSTLKSNSDYHEAQQRLTLRENDIERNDPFLVETVETLGEKSWGKNARLKIVDVPDGISWKIQDYGGNEHVAEVHRTWD